MKKILVAGLVLAVGLAAGGCKKETPTTPDGGSGGIELSGLISQGGAAQAGVDVYLSWGASRKATTGADGRFSFKDLPAGTYIVTPVRSDTSFSPSNFECGASRSDLNFAAGSPNYGNTPGTRAPVFTAADQTDDSVSLSSYNGRVVLIDFTADWCTECRAKAETADKFYTDYREKGFMYILCVIEGSASNWAATYHLTFPVLDDHSQIIYGQYKGGETNLPMPMVLDRNHTIRYKKTGWNKAEVEDWLKKLL